jgi:hypothetical protein
VAGRGLSVEGLRAVKAGIGANVVQSISAPMNRNVTTRPKMISCPISIKHASSVAVSSDKEFSRRIGVTPSHIAR